MKYHGNLDLRDPFLRLESMKKIFIVIGGYLRASPVIHWKMAYTPVLDETIDQSGLKVGVGTPNWCLILGFQETPEKQNKLLLVECLHLLPSHFLLLNDWSH